MSLLRIDRSMTLGVVRPMRRMVNADCADCLPVLMYHSVSTDEEADVSPYYRVAITPVLFAEHMKWIADAGWRGVSLEEGMSTLASGKNPAKPQVAITFDDGFRNFYKSAWPELKHHGFTATMYLPTGFISEDRKSFLGRECLTWDEILEMSLSGIRFGSHTVNHPKLYQLSWDEIESELAQSKQTIEKHLGERISSFAYPYAFPQEDGEFVARLSRLLRKCGYDTCATTAIGRMGQAENPLWVRRIPANSCDDHALLLSKIKGDYDWVRFPQRFSRWAKARSSHSKRVDAASESALDQARNESESA